MKFIEMISKIIEMIIKINTFVDEIDLQKEGSIIILAIAVCFLAIMILISINNNSVEEIFMNKKERFINYFSKFLSLLVIFIPGNIILAKVSMVLIFGCLFFLFAFISYLFYEWKASRKYPKELSKLSLYCKEKSADAFLISIIWIAPVFVILMYRSENPISLVNSAVIVSVIEVFIIFLSIPGLIMRESENFFLKDDNTEVYIYKQIDNNTVLCGNNPDISKSEKYLFISYDYLKEKEIIHIKHKNLTREEKKDLKRKYKNFKGNKRKKIRINKIHERFIRH